MFAAPLTVRLACPPKFDRREVSIRSVPTVSVPPVATVSVAEASPERSALPLKLMPLPVAVPARLFDACATTFEVNVPLPSVMLAALALSGVAAIPPAVTS